MMEAKSRTVGFKPGERNVFFHILTACNLRCQHCYINRAQHGSTTLDIETIKNWLKLFHDPLKQSNLILLGGEPTLHPEIGEAIRFAKQLNFNVTVDTNGYLFNDFFDKTSPEELDYLSFSIDGPSAVINDGIRGKGVYEKCIENLQQATSKGYKVSVIYTVSSKNIDYLHEMVELLDDLSVKRFFIQVIGLRGESVKNKDSVSTEDKVGIELQVNRERWLNVVPEVAKACAEKGIHVTYPKVYLNNDELFECAGQVAENYFIFPNGRVYQCPLCEDYGLHTFSIKNNKLVKRNDITEEMFFSLTIQEGCVMNKLLQPENLEYDKDGKVKNRVSCCLLKQEIFI